LEGQQVVFTGFRNKEWEDILKTVGCRVASGVSKKVFRVIAADPSEESSKIEKAREYGIPIQSKDAFAKAFGLP
jgi:NAD-dependent DNA ligase